jgi:hypothetical protein
MSVNDVLFIGQKRNSLELFNVFEKRFTLKSCPLLCLSTFSILIISLSLFVSAVFCCHRYQNPDKKTRMNQKTDKKLLDSMLRRKRNQLLTANRKHQKSSA